MATSSRPHGTIGPSDVGEWMSRTFPYLRRLELAGTPVDDLLPDDPLADVEETWHALERIRTHAF